MEVSEMLTRRSLLGAAAGGAVTLAWGALPAWARGPGLRRPDSRPFPHLPAGTPSIPEIEHVVVLMMENHSFDNLLGMVGAQVPGRRQVDGLHLRGGKPVNVNRDAAGHPVVAMHATSPCQLSGVPTQAWNASHQSWDNGRNDGFVLASGPVAMEYWDRSDLPFTYSLVRHFPIGQRYFSSALAQTYPNRRFLFCGTSNGLVATNLEQTLHLPAPNGTIFDRLDQHRVSWRVYYEDAPSPLIVPGFAGTPKRAARLERFSQFYSDAAAGRLPSFTFLDPNYTTTSQENPQDIQVGEGFIAKVVHALMRAPTWKRTALFVTYDEHGGYYDHVPPPRAIKPDDSTPLPVPGQPPLVPGGFDRYGFRVPLMVVSPWAKAGYISSVVQDHTSITAFVEHKWNLPAMTWRDANAAPMLDYFDFRRPAFLKPPALPGPPGLARGLAACHAAGLNPPLSEPGTISG
jgi:phospholipase C